MTETIAIDNSALGMTPDLRDKNTGVAKLLKHFNILTRQNTLTPYLSSSNADSSSATNQLTDFIQYGNQTVYGIGTNSSTTKVTILSKNPGTAVWSAAANNQSSSGKTLVTGTVAAYHSFFYGATNDGKIFKADPSGSAAWVDANSSFGLASYSNGLVHSKDDILYYGYGNIIASNNAGSWTTSALTLPTGFTITRLCEYGNYLAIGGYLSIGSNSYYKSLVYLWDRDSTLNTISEVIDFGTGILEVIEQLEGQLIGISLRGNILTGTADRVVFRSYSGGVADVFKELVASTPGITVAYAQKEDQKLYFSMGITIDGVVHNGIWGIGRGISGKWAVWCDRLPDNDTAIALGSITGFLISAEYALISYNDGGYHLTESTAAAYSSSSLVETVVNPGMSGRILTHASAQKQLQVFSASYDPIPSGGQVIGKYRIDGGAWTTIFTETTVGKMFTEMPLDASGTAFTAGREYQFRLESMGGVMLSGFKYKYEILSTLI